MERKALVVMLVDDDPDFLELNKHVLEAGGYRVLCFADPEEALEEIEVQRPHLVITDLMMNTLDSGFSFSRRLKEDSRFRNIPVVIVTSIGSRRGLDFSPRTPEELAAMDADAYFDKPVASKALLAKVQELLEHSVQEDPK